MIIIPLKKEMRAPNRIIADPRFGIHYISYYIVGIKRLGIPFVYRVIEDFPLRDAAQLSRGMAFLIEGKKVFIDANDHNDIDFSVYEWCDIYAKINVKKEDLRQQKILAIGPSFSVRLANPASIIALGVGNYFRSLKGWNARVHPTFRQFIKGYLYMIMRRCSFKEYEKVYEEDSNYVFTMNTLWYDRYTDTVTNRFRGIFAKTCKKLMPIFEGGFFYISQPNVEKEFPQYKKYLEDYRDIIFTERIGMKDYLRKIKQSAFVFNTPAVSGCHGWKLGEYFALGKAIISTPLNNAMPGEFLSGKHYIEVQDEQEIENAVVSLKNNEEMRQALKRNAGEYYERFLAPDAVIKRILERCC